MHALLIHGMGRTPLSMLVLARRLKTAGMQVDIFGYSATFETWNGCCRRLRSRIERIGDRPYILVGHSLGSVLIRGVSPQVAVPPRACFFLAPPACACRAARRLVSWRLYRWLNGEMGQLLAWTDFMAGLPVPSVPIKIYAGTGGPVGPWSPFGDQTTSQRFFSGFFVPSVIPSRGAVP
ncbi:MAG: alpha/beta hydrolase [Methylococcaceae bacterium]|nr:alpha/beta hydrolase [Methylococcaceae bacterium]